MGAATKTKPAPPAAAATSTPDGYQAALAEWKSIDGRLRDLTRSIERLEHAMWFASVQEIPERAKHIAAEVTGLILSCRRSPLRAAADLESLRFDLSELRPKHTAARERYLIARSQEAVRVAETFRARHGDAVQAIIDAVESLAEALKAERLVRAEYAAVSPEPTSCLLPNVSDDLAEADLAKWDSAAARWARRIRSLRS
ncbi:hypothetical protein RX327_20020 [Bradyrhizobium sp. BEA-2-5]|uniref:hypothetical protein n=1 Tax=Bradyrhizobium sp. BEA-2-5 TaxID=3080015 RepID=UPI00293EB2C8|nr:hypothetical protein [Bradyrhizobium sp. BEA-2-5]WOH78257.1 hypothetical protein RX327_20020 [Bradyrhizobium sp. BEA-2-5]